MKILLYFHDNVLKKKVKNKLKWRNYFLNFFLISLLEEINVLIKDKNK